MAQCSERRELEKSAVGTAAASKARMRKKNGRPFFEKGGRRVGSSSMDDGESVLSSPAFVTPQAICARKTAPASLQRGADRSEIGLQLGADALNRRDDRERDARGDEAILDGGCAGLVSQEFANCFHAIVVAPILNAALNPVAETCVYLTNSRR